MTDRLILVFIGSLFLGPRSGVIADSAVYNAVCRDAAGAQSFFIEEHLADGLHTDLQVAKVDFLPNGRIARLLVLSAVPGAIEEGDSFVSSDLFVRFSSNADQRLLIRKANITLATEGETGPIIESFRFHHDNGEILYLIDDSNTLPCLAGDADSGAYSEDTPYSEDASATPDTEGNPSVENPPRSWFPAWDDWLNRP